MARKQQARILFIEQTNNKIMEIALIPQLIIHSPDNHQNTLKIVGVRDSITQETPKTENYPALETVLEAWNNKEEMKQHTYLFHPTENPPHNPNTIPPPRKITNMKNPNYKETPDETPPNYTEGDDLAH